MQIILTLFQHLLKMCNYRFCEKPRDIGKNMLRALCVLCIMLFTAGCTSYGVVANEPRKTTTYTGEDNYSFHAAAENLNATTDTTFLLSFSGGGTRAAALAYGV